MSFLAIIDPLTELVPQYLNTARDTLDFMLTCKSIMKKTKILNVMCPPERLFDVLTNPLGANVKSITFNSYGHFKYDWKRDEDEKNLLAPTASSRDIKMCIIIGEKSDYVKHVRLEKSVTIKLDRDLRDGRIPIKSFRIRIPQLDQKKINRFLSMINPEDLAIHIENELSPVNVILQRMTRLTELNLMQCRIAGGLPIDLKTVYLSECEPIGHKKKCFAGLDLEYLFIQGEWAFSLEGVKRIKYALFNEELERMMLEVAKVHDLIDYFKWDDYYQSVFFNKGGIFSRTSIPEVERRKQYDEIYAAYKEGRRITPIYDEDGNFQRFRC